MYLLTIKGGGSTSRNGGSTSPESALSRQDIKTNCQLLQLRHFLTRRTQGFKLINAKKAGFQNQLPTPSITAIFYAKNASDLREVTLRKEDL